MPFSPSPAPSSQQYDFTLDKVEHYDDVSFEEFCIRAHVPTWQALADDAQLSRGQTQHKATLQDSERVPKGLSVPVKRTVR